MLYDKICSERERLTQEIDAIEKQLTNLPEGKLLCYDKGTYVKWYRSDGHKSTYLPKKDKKLAEQLAIRKYLTAQKESRISEQRAIDFYLRHHTDNNSAEQLLVDGSPYAKLLAPYFSPVSQELQEWTLQPYARNPAYPEQCIQKTTAGILVRSKSEALIVMLLHTNRIPFRYECALPLDAATLYPDFTIRHPQTGKVFYWEHFGMMDQPHYAKHACSKLQLYISNGIIPSIQLLTTYETKDHPLDLQLAENLVKNYFC